jgi:hypothetical protein
MRQALRFGDMEEERDVNKIEVDLHTNTIEHDRKAYNFDVSVPCRMVPTRIQKGNRGRME